MPLCLWHFLCSGTLARRHLPSRVYLGVHTVYGVGERAAYPMGLSVSPLAPADRHGIVLSRSRPRFTRTRPSHIHAVDVTPSFTTDGLYRAFLPLPLITVHRARYERVPRLAPTISAPSPRRSVTLELSEVEEECTMD